MSETPKKADSQGPDNPSSSKQRLDAIRAAGPAQRPPIVTDQTSPGLSLKEQLDAIPSPKGAEGPAAPAPAKRDAGGILGRKTGGDFDKSALDSIPTPGGGGHSGPQAGAPARGASPPETVSRDALDAIPTPGSGASAGGGGFNLSDLDSIPTPGTGGARPATSQPSPAAPSAGHQAAAPAGNYDLSALDAIPTPGSGGGGAGAKPAQAGEVPQWMRNFEQHQSSISGNKPTGGGGGYAAGNYGGGGGGYGAPDAVPQSYGASRGGEAAPPQGSTYNMIIGVIVIICIAMFGYLMVAKPEPAKIPETDTSTTPASSAPTTSTPVAPVTPSMPASTPMNMNNTAMPGAPQGMQPGMQPGTPQIMPPPGTVPANQGMIPAATPVQPQVPVNNVPSPTANPYPYAGNNP